MDLVDILAGLGPENLAEKRKALMQWRINSAMGMLAPTTGTGVEAATRMLPMTGEAWTANDAGNAIQDGQYGKAAMMGLLGLLPLGGMMSAGLRAGASVPKRMGQSGAIAWHGSPHKFDKFSLDKIGTGEGAQAYGHGLYLAEHPEVAQSYKAAGTFRHNQIDIDGTPYVASTVMNSVTPNNVAADAFSRFGNKEDAISWLSDDGMEKEAKAILRKAKSIKDVTDEMGNLYKTDIPDEAVARFLDWDKPLSQQAPEVQAALKKVTDSTHGKGTWDQWIKGGHDYRDFRNDLMEIPESDISQLLHKQGIPGIRYLEGGSRSNGAGTSNFVAFDPELIRILERNGIPTGNQPWKPGEWQGMLSGTK